MKLPVPPSQTRNCLSNRKKWADFVRKKMLLWRRRLTDDRPDELRSCRDDLESRIECWERRASKVLDRAADLAREIASYAELDEVESVQRLRRMVMGVPRDLWEARAVFSEAVSGDRNEIENLANRYTSLRQKAQREKFALRIVKYVHGLYLNGIVSSVHETTDLHPSTEEYLRAAYRWFEAGNRPSGDRPEEFWKHIAEETGTTKHNLREVFKNHGWYDPHVSPDTTPSEYLIEKLQTAFTQHLGRTSMERSTDWAFD